MISYTSHNCKRGIVETGRRVEYVSAREPSQMGGCLVGLLAMVLLIFIILWLGGAFTLFEDGSWMLGPLNGCLPGAICRIGG